MNTIIQNILAFSSVLLALAFIIKKFFYKKKAKKACGTDDCSCH
ncbi:FeoB-associated Cys-rich membrane protein [Oceanihabitans sp. 2_MG-2023]|nr:FeoB-associated Cys-rich membrane protein [Oceanihabitans sp. 2_MG-2023]MDO6595985.1 FeoB-associated Cys-rich membrane protein [Oceanihabitans sp. 2_MG-2023]